MFSFNPIKLTKTVVGQAANFGEKIIHKTTDAADNTINFGKKFGQRVLQDTKIIGTGVVNGTGAVAKFVVKGAEITADAAVVSLKFQAGVTRIGLEKAFDFSRDTAGKGLDLVRNGFDRVTHPGDPNPPAAQGLTFAETKSASELAYKRNDVKAGDIYRFPDGKQWRVAEVSDNPQTGFRAVALKPVDENDKRVIVAFSGSDEGVDWGDNIRQGVGLSTAQYNSAVDFANKWKASDGNNVILTGHSLGGGLASYASIKTDLRATAVNSAPLSLNHLGLNPFDALHITQYYVPGEALSIVNKANPLDIRPGFGLQVQGKDSILDPRSIGSNHSLGNVAPAIPAPVKVN